MAISLLDIKKGQKVRRKDEEKIISSSTQPTINNSNQTINLADIRSGKSTIKPVQPVQDIVQIKATETTKNSVVNNIPTTNTDGYTDTGKKFGDYYYQEYAKKGQYKVYSKDDNYYYYDEENQIYKPFGNLSWMTTKEQDKKDYEEAVKAGYKGSKNTLKVTDRLKLDTANLTKKEYEEYEEDLQRQQEKKNKKLNEVRVGGSGLQGTVGEIKNSAKNIKENLIEPISRTPENYKLGQLNEKLGLEAYKKMEGKKNNYAEIKRQIDNYNKFNQDIVNSTNLLDQNTQNLPNQLGGLKSGIKGGGVGGAIGAGIGGVVGAVTTKTPAGAIAGAEKGAKILGKSGYVAGQSKYTYELEAGYQYQTLLDMGVPENIAKEEAKKVGTVNALIESGESILDLATLGKASQAKQLLTDNLVKKYGLEMVKNWTKNASVSYTTNVLSEGIEEGLQETTSIASEKSASKKAGIERDNSGDLERIKDSAVAGAFGALLTGGVTRVASIGTNQTLNNLSNSAIKNQQNKPISNQSIANTVNALNLGQNQAITNKNTLGNTNNQNAVNFPNIGINNTKVDFISSAKQNNIDVNTETVKTINSKLLERGIKAKFDSNEFANSNENAFWRVTTDENGNTTREVVFNPNAQTEDLLQNVAVHELYHDIANSKDGQNISKQLLDFASTKEGYTEARQSLEQLYSAKYDIDSPDFKAKIDEEAVASILGKKLGNQEFVSQLTTEKPTLSRTVYNWVVDKLNKLNKLTGYKSEKLFWTDVKNKFDNAYRASSNIDNPNTKFMVTGYNGAKQLDINMSTNEFSKNYKEALQLEKQGKSKQVIRKQTGWYKDVNGDWKFEISDESAKLKITPKTNTIYKLNDLMSHNFIYDMYKKIGDTDVKFIDIEDKIQNGEKRVVYGYVNKVTGKIYLNNKIINNKNKILQTLLHEVQHKIQKNENFQNGTYMGKNKNKYDNNFGEMEARETWKRKNMTLDERIMNPSFTSIYDGTNSNKKIYTKKDSKWYTIFGGSISENSEGNKEISKGTIRKNVHSTLNEELTNSSFSLQENSSKWDEHLNQHYQTDGTGQTLSQVKNKVMNPLEIASLKPEDANTTPNLNKVKVETGNGKSSFYNNVTNKTEMLSEENRTKLSTESDIEFYKEVTNKESLDEAYQRLNDGGASETLNWINKKSEQANATDIAEGWILLKQYQDAGDYDSMVQVAKKMREMGTKAGQTVQAFNIMARLTPEGMVKYAQSELIEAYNLMVKNKTKQWIDKNASNFDLTPQETQFIVDTMKEVATMEDGYNKKVKLAEIQKMLQDKLPPEKGAGIKSWMRISMLFNPKTQVRNIMGNAIITPVNALSDTFSALVDKQIAKKTGVRTTGVTNIKQYGKGFKEGLYQSYNDFKKGINTRDMQGNRFEIGQGKSFKNDNLLGKSLNKIDRILNFALDAGDRPFYEATFTNSINNQLVLNNTTEVTQEMIDIATQEALSRTWQDNNNYTKMVLNIRKNLNRLNIGGYGLGDVLIPFAKTPANLTKAIVDYSPAGLVSSLLEGNKLKKSLSNGQYDIRQQHKFVQNLGKATAGTMLYVLGYALAKAKITSGENDEDKDVANFMKNTLGIQPYSIKIGNRTFTYDWAQPVAAPFAITANYLNNTNENAQLHEKILSAVDTGLNLIFEQSFMSSIQNVLSSYNGLTEGIINQILDLPARGIPTFLKQVNDLIDKKTRTSFEKGEPVKTATNKVKAKIPGLSSELPTSRDSLGREIEKYGGENNPFNVFINPANTTKGKESESAKEIYKVYQETGDKSIMPRVAPYSITLNGKSKTLSAEERSEFQKISGEIVEENVKKLTTNNKYKKLSDEDKAEVIYGIVGFAYNKAKAEVLDTDVATTYKTANKYVKNGGALYDFYANKVYKNRG